MIRKDINVDVVMDVLIATAAAYPASNFVKSLLFQYQQRGGLSKKQLQDLYDKAAKVNGLPVGKLATLEAIILKKPTRYKSVINEGPVVVTKNVKTGALMEEILIKYPQHKMLVFLKAKYDNNETFTANETTEVERFYTVLLKKSII